MRLVLAGVIATVVMSSAGPLSTPLIVAHRGDVNPVDGWPENTFEAVSQAHERNPGRFEVDVQRSADGTWWVIHDTTVDRTTNGVGAVASLTDHQLAALTITGGEGYRNQTGLKVPRLETLVPFIRGAEWVQLDLKESSAEAFTELAKWIVAHNLVDNVLIRPRAPFQVDAVRQVDPNIRLLGVGLGGVDWEAVPVSRVRSANRPLVVFEDYQTSWTEREKLHRAASAGAAVWMTDNLPVALKLSTRRTVGVGSR